MREAIPPGAQSTPSDPPQASEERYRDLFENSPVPIWEEDMSGIARIFEELRAAGVGDLESHRREHPDVAQRCAEAVRVVDVNRAAVAMHRAGSKADLIAGLLETFVPESFDAYRQQLVALWNRRTAHQTQAVVRTLAGEPRQVTVSVKVSPGHEDALSRVLVTLVDVTEQQRAEAAIRESERRYREVFENSSDAMYVLEVCADGRFRNLDVNPAFERSTGLTAAEVIGKYQEDTVDAETALVVSEKYRRCIERGAPVEEEAELNLPSGRKSYQSTLVPVRDDGGRIYRIVGISRDVTELKRSLAEIGDLYNNAPCGYHSLDASGTLVRVNDTELQWLGYRRDELVGTRRFQELLTPASREAFEHVFRSFLERGSLRDLEVELVRKDGSILPVMLSSTAERDLSGRLVMSRATLVDITQRRKVEEQLRQAQKLEAVGRLASGVAHDFNNVLTVILTAGADIVETMSEGHPLRGEAKEILAAAERARTLTRQLLAFSHRQQVEPRVFDLDQVIARMDKMLRRIIGEDIELVVTSDGRPHHVRADPGQIEQVILNLAVNARDAMPGGGRLVLETRRAPGGEAPADVSGEAGERVMLAVADDGTGMTPDVVMHLFEPFFTTKERGRGTGLGLSTVYGIVKQSGGEILVETEPGRGSTFRVYLPMGTGTPESLLDEVAGQSPEGGHEVVLLTEDDPLVRTLVVRSLRRLGYTVLEAADGEQAMRIASTGTRIDLLATDVVMPRMGGVELASRMRALLPELRVLFLSGYANENAPLASGPGTAFLQKPFTAEGLSRKVRELLG